MMKKNRYIFTCGFFMLTSICYAQFSIPSMDVKLVGGGSITTGGTGDFEGFEGVVIGGELNVHINEHLAVGPFFSKGVSMTRLGQNSDSDFNAEQWIYGFQVRLSTDRSHKVRPYLNLNYYKSEFVVDYDDFRTAGETAGFGAGIGLLVKLSNRIYLNAIDLSIKKPSEDLFLMPGVDFLIQAHVGVSYNFGRKR